MLNEQRITGVGFPFSLGYPHGAQEDVHVAVAAHERLPGSFEILIGEGGVAFFKRMYRSILRFVGEAE